MNLTAIVLAAGRSSRMGAQKLLLPLGDMPMIARVLDACAHLPTLVVASADLLPWLDEHGVRSVVNDEPERGMTHSLRLADAAVPPDDAMLVLLGDKPFVTRALVDRIISASGGFDICFPSHDGVGGHPVVFAPRARAALASVPDGDDLRRIRDDPALRRNALPSADRGAYRDIDDPGDVAAARGEWDR